MKTERFELRLDPGMLDRLDAWRAQQSGVPSRAEAVRRLMEIGLGAKGLRISDGEKLILSMLRDLHRHWDAENGEIDPDFVLDALVGGHHWALGWQYEGLFQGNEDPDRAVSEVVEILEMWWLLERGYEELAADDKAYIVSKFEPSGGDLRFPGFDGNNESKYLGIAKFLIEKMDRFPVFKGRELNSHAPMLDGYRRMMPIFELMRSKLIGKELEVAEIIHTLNARL